jgi:DNA replication protein DnaC
VEQFLPCRRCKKNGRIPNGYYQDPNNFKALMECDHHIVWRQNRDLFRKYVNHGFREDGWDLKFPDQYIGEKSRSNMERLVKFVEVFKENSAVRGCTLYLQGRSGCQKTLLANWVGAELTRAGFNCRFILMNELIHILMKADRNEDAQDEIDDLVKCDLLIYDESFDLIKAGIYSTGWQLSYIDTFIRSRLRNTANIFISNVSIDDIDPKFGPSLKDLMRRETNYFNSNLLFDDNFMDNVGAIPNNGLF